MKQKPKCEDIGFDHLWVGGSNHAKPTTRTCSNCGKRQKLQPQQWVDYPYEKIKEADSALHDGNVSVVLPWDVT